MSPNFEYFCPDVSQEGKGLLSIFVAVFLAASLETRNSKQVVVSLEIRMDCYAAVRAALEAEPICQVESHATFRLCSFFLSYGHRQRQNTRLVLALLRVWQTVSTYVIIGTCDLRLLVFRQEYVTLIRCDTQVQPW